MAKSMSDWDWAARIYNRDEAGLRVDVGEAQAEGFDPFKEKVDGVTLLNMCAQVDWAQGCAWVAPFSDLGALDPEGDTPLMAALKMGSGAAARDLARREKTWGLDADGNNPLHVAISHGALVVAGILAGKADLSARCAEGNTALMMALRAEEEPLALALIKLSDSSALTERDPEGETVLTLAIKMDLPQAALALTHIGDGVQVSIKDGHGMTPLSLSLGASMDAVSLELAKKADPNARDSDGDDGFSCALAWGFDEVAEILARRMDVSSKNGEGRDALTIAWDEERYELAKVIVLRSGIDVESGLDEGSSHIHRALRLRDFQSAAHLLGVMDEGQLSRAIESESEPSRVDTLSSVLEAKQKGLQVDAAMLASSEGLLPQSQAEGGAIVGWLSKVFR